MNAKNIFKWGAVGVGLYFAYMWLTERKGTVTVEPIQQYPAAWDGYWNTQNTTISASQKTAIQNGISQGNITFL
jgi:hypothetical protein